MDFNLTEKGEMFLGEDESDGEYYECEEAFKPVDLKLLSYLSSNRQTYPRLVQALEISARKLFPSRYKVSKPAGNKLQALLFYEALDVNGDRVCLDKRYNIDLSMFGLTCLSTLEDYLVHEGLIE